MSTEVSSAPNTAAEKSGCVEAATKPQSTEDVAMAAPPAPPPVPPPPPAASPKETVYVNNLNQKVSRGDLMHGLREVFSQYGLILEIVCYTKIQRCKGQAWVVFDRVESAREAVANLQGFWFFGKPMRVAFARRTSDATLRKLGKPVPIRIRAPKRKKSAMRASDQQSDASADSNAPESVSAAAAANAANDGHPSSTVNGITDAAQLASSEVRGIDGVSSLADSADAAMTDVSGGLTSMTTKITSNSDVSNSDVGSSSVSANNATATTEPREKRRRVARRRDAAPNKMLFVEGLPSDRTLEELTSVFGSYPGFSKVTLIESKPTIAFVEYIDMFHAAPAVESVHGYDLRGSLICVSYAAQ